MRPPEGPSLILAASAERAMPRKLIAKTLAKQVTGQARGQRQHRARQREHDLDHGRGQKRRAQHGLEGQPLGDEAVERRQRRDREHAYEKQRSGPGHAADQTAEPVHVGGADPGLDDAGTGEQERLVEGVIDQMIEPGDQRDAGDDAVPRGGEDHPAPSAAMMIPMFSIELWASARRRSSSMVA